MKKLIVVLMLILMIGVLWSEIIKLNDETIIGGKIVAKKNSYLYVQTDKGLIKVELMYVKTIKNDAGLPITKRIKRKKNYNDGADLTKAKDWKDVKLEKGWIHSEIMQGWEIKEIHLYHKIETDALDFKSFKGIEHIKPTLNDKTLDYSIFTKEGINAYPFECPNKYSCLAEIDISYNQGAEYKKMLNSYTGSYEDWIYKPLNMKLFYKKVIDKLKELGANGVMDIKIKHYYAYQLNKSEEPFGIHIIRFTGYAIREK